MIQTQGHGGQQQMNIDVSQTTEMKCDKCGNNTFKQSMMLRKVSAIVSPTGQAGLVPVQVYSCGNCGEVPSQLLEGSGLNVEEKE